MKSSSGQFRAFNFQTQRPWSLCSKADFLCVQRSIRKLEFSGFPGIVTNDLREKERMLNKRGSLRISRYRATKRDLAG